MRISILILIFIFPLLSQAINCVGYHEHIDEQNNAIFRSLPLTVEYQDKETLKLSGDLANAHFMALADKGNDSYLLMVTLGPAYTSGVTAGLTWDQDNSMRISRVDQNTVYRLVCKK